MKIVTLVLLLTMGICKIKASCDNSLRGKSALVTGGAGGIGYAISYHLILQGVGTLYIVDYNRQKGIEAEKSLRATSNKTTIHFIYADIRTDLEPVLKFIRQNNDCIDILINNAGIFDENDPKATMDTNARSPIVWANVFYECMRTDKGGKGGTIIFTASIVAYYNWPAAYNYVASKYALLGFTLSLGHEFNENLTGVRVFSVCPGYTYTDMTNKKMVLDEHEEVLAGIQMVGQTADAVGQGTAYLYKTAKTGIMYTIEGGNLLEASPDRIDVKIDKNMKVTVSKKCLVPCK